MVFGQAAKPNLVIARWVFSNNLVLPLVAMMVLIDLVQATKDAWSYVMSTPIRSSLLLRI